MRTIQYLILLTLVAFFAGCATVPPTELVDARYAYQQASNGPAQQLTPAELHKAQEALALAEESFKKDPRSYKTKDLSYVALRKAELAAALGLMAADKASKDKANADFLAKQTAIVKQGKDDLIASEKQAQQALLDTEKQKSDALAAELAAIAAVKEEERGLVLTLSGGVLFLSAKSTLLPSAQTKLDQVAKALLDVSPPRNLIVEGYTDSQGSESYNQGLSQRRADAVRDYLVQKGYPADHIQTRGMGEGSPIASNASAEGRANNRRVEIVIEHEMASSNK
jgi:outer membrane protein OmpA-like peptidoglycan-associated protein